MTVATFIKQNVTGNKDLSSIYDLIRICLSDCQQCIMMYDYNYYSDDLEGIPYFIYRLGSEEEAHKFAQLAISTLYKDSKTLCSYNNTNVFFEWDKKYLLKQIAKFYEEPNSPDARDILVSVFDKLIELYTRTKSTLLSLTKEPYESRV